MADYVLPDETEVTFDLEKMTVKEYRDFAKGAQSDAEDDLLMARVTGLAVEQIESLSQPTYRRLIKAFYDKSRQPLNDPN